MRKCVFVLKVGSIVYEVFYLNKKGSISKWESDDKVIIISRPMRMRTRLFNTSNRDTVVIMSFVQLF